MDRIESVIEVTHLITESASSVTSPSAASLGARVVVASHSPIQLRPEKSEESSSSSRSVPPIVCESLSSSDEP